ncbi:MAG: flagellar protein [Bdellovibrionales bacterium]|nr:flagellar protein [Bdellovibrionales bacterium]
MIPKVGSAGGAAAAVAERPSTLRQGGEFDSILKGRLGDAAKAGSGAPAQPLKFSGHAMDRIRERGIPMNGELMGKLEKAVQSAADKGAKESLVLAPEGAFIVSVKNRTVITVLDRASMNGNVFTNIDSTVVL